MGCGGIITRKTDRKNIAQAFLRPRDPVTGKSMKIEARENRPGVTLSEVDKSVPFAPALINRGIWKKKYVWGPWRRKKETWTPQGKVTGRKGKSHTVRPKVIKAHLNVIRNTNAAVLRFPKKFLFISPEDLAKL